MTPQQFDNSEDIIIIGTAQSTSPRTAADDIPAVWQRFMGEGIAAQVPRRADDASIYAVYCDYASDYRGPYTLVLGVAVEAAAEVPAGLRRVRIPSGRYARFIAQGDPARVIWQTWTEINEVWAERTERRYVADFERYDPDSLSGGAVHAEVVVGLR